ncbi:hypothetical protein ACWCQZ_46355 [Streptomyces sp. NPDC002285]
MVRNPMTDNPKPDMPPDPRAAFASQRDNHAEYSATVLGSHWVERPTLTTDETLKISTNTTPGRPERSALRFGPGVTIADRDRYDAENNAIKIWRGTIDEPVSKLSRKHRPRLRLRTLALAVLIAVLSFLLWQRLWTNLEVQSVTVKAPSNLGCNGTVDVTAIVRTNGGAGKLTYKWIRSDGTTSGELNEKLQRGQSEVRLHLLWTFQGTGKYPAWASLQLTSPTRERKTAELTYFCRR